LDIISVNQKVTMFKLMNLPYEDTALEPVISAKTLELHHGAHHKTYVNVLNQCLTSESDDYKDLPDLIEKTYDVLGKSKVFNNAAQVWNHDFYWHSLAPYQTSALSEKLPLYRALQEDFGSIDSFFKTFAEKAVAQFGSGWAFLVRTPSGKLVIRTTSNADVPFLNGDRPILSCDVWEHAYYIDHQNKRLQYVEQLIHHLWNWSFAQKNDEDPNAAYRFYRS
jgi:superoxide dismutase, Fe-Mn family